MLFRVELVIPSPNGKNLSTPCEHQSDNTCGILWVDLVGKVMINVTLPLLYSWPVGGLDKHDADMKIIDSFTQHLTTHMHISAYNHRNIYIYIIHRCTAMSTVGSSLCSNISPCRPSSDSSRQLRRPMTMCT